MALSLNLVALSQCAAGSVYRAGNLPTGGGAEHDL